MGKISFDDVFCEKQRLYYQVSFDDRYVRVIPVSSKLTHYIQKISKAVRVLVTAIFDETGTNHMYRSSSMY